MGRSKKPGKSEGELYDNMSKILVPEFILKNFEISDIKEEKEYWMIELQENEHLLPASLQNESDVVLDGFCHAIDLLSHSFSLKPVYLRVYRRRWKKSGSDQHFSNQYDLTIKGIKMVPELGIFLKEEDRRLSC
jgi:hypothetical protein